MSNETKEACCIAKEREAYMKECPTVTSVYFPLGRLERADRTGTIKTGQAVEVNYNRVLKNGAIRDTRLITFFVHKFCPFCGKKY